MTFDKFCKKYNMCIDKISYNNHFLFTVNKPSNELHVLFFLPIVTYQNILNVIYFWFYYHRMADTLFSLNDMFETPEETFSRWC